MSEERSLRVVTTDRCSLCSTALANLRLPSLVARVRVVPVDLLTMDHPDVFATRVPVVLDQSGRVLAEGRVSALQAWIAVLRVRSGSRRRRDQSP